MWIYEKKLQYPVRIKNPNPALAKLIISQYGGPHGELGASLRYLSQQVDIWRRQLMLNEELTAEQKLLARYTALTECVSNNRYPGCLFIAACTYYPDPGHPIHQLADQQKRAAHDFTHELLTTLEVDDPAMVAKQMELVLEGCLSRMLVNRRQADVDTAHRLAEDILRFAQCRMGGALT